MLLLKIYLKIKIENRNDCFISIIEKFRGKNLKLSISKLTSKTNMAALEVT